MRIRAISGGQTGTDRGALDGARLAGWETGGWAPAGYNTEDGPDPSLAGFGLIEHRNLRYHDRTLRNVLDSDCTVLIVGKNSPGSALTKRLCDQHDKPCLVLHRRELTASIGRTVEWLRVVMAKLGHEGLTANFAGNRESVSPGIEQATREFVLRLAAEIGRG